MSLLLFIRSIYVPETNEGQCSNATLLSMKQHLFYCVILKDKMLIISEFPKLLIALRYSAIAFDQRLISLLRKYFQQLLFEIFILVSTAVKFAVKRKNIL